MTPRPIREPLEVLEGARVVFVSDYYDRPLSGTALYNDSLFWFDTPDEYGPSLLYPLTVDEQAEERAIQELFEEHVGLHYSYDPQGRKMASRAHPDVPKGRHDKFYKSRRNRNRSATYTSRLPLGILPGSLHVYDED